MRRVCVCVCMRACVYMCVGSRINRAKCLCFLFPYFLAKIVGRRRVMKKRKKKTHTHTHTRKKKR